MATTQTAGTQANSPADLLQQAAGREAIRLVMLRYCHGIDRLDAECMKSAYWPDAIDDHGTFVGNAWDFVERCMSSHERWRSTLHCVFNHWIEFGPGPGTARGEAYNVTYLFPRDAPGVHLWCGRYLDEYHRRDGEWRISKRVCVHEGTAVHDSGPMPMAVELFRQGSFDRPSSARPIGP